VKFPLKKIAATTTPSSIFQQACPAIAIYERTKWAFARCSGPTRAIETRNAEGAKMEGRNDGRAGR